ncbi:hypothetical protein EYF80_067554 [Liparis tanakae]|uniref:Uncharacterized protein n=1 Tax=Liparis tanakae TaxID=230148 RepID=A0A4Z2E1T2_9TELE|nr:hypothetical protein EYF80_067554 [Liparis tanakae]
MEDEEKEGRGPMSRQPRGSGPEQRRRSDSSRVLATSRPTRPRHPRRSVPPPTQRLFVRFLQKGTKMGDKAL